MVSSTFRGKVKELVIHNFKVGAIPYDTPKNARIFFSKIVPAICHPPPTMSIENCYQHVNREIRLKQLTNFGKKRERVHNRTVESIIHCVPSEARFLEERIAYEKSKKWELICPFTGYKAGDKDDWLGILEEAIRKVTYLDHLNLDMEMVEDADPYSDTVCDA
ncbi:hypothetical protein L486_00141 [Kwoniella mangroviensis CBS 10435]|uniref:Uncharacterized protein n=1 Tax=Kwoniella mangroviensis CBS 10435 TaxID=1331196 RepID=A0A1B9IY92_9TREE|nr:hypothetical protein L486_00141 [Kwoniella mangroviensis CBS 10435]